MTWDQTLYYKKLLIYIIKVKGDISILQPFKKNGQYIIYYLIS